MRLPAKVEYAYKAIIELSIRYRGDSPVQINTICQSQGIPKKFLTQLLLRLKNAGIVDSSRGIAGGYYLTRPPSQVSLADVFNAVDDTILGGTNKSKSGKSREADRLIFAIISDINDGIADKLKKMTFDKLISQIKSEQLTYYI